MNLTLSTPALLFPAVSLLLLAYSNRFLHLASLIRKLHGDALAGHDLLVHDQLANLRHRLALIRAMQLWGVASLFGCTVSMGALLLGWETVGVAIFGLSVLMMAVSLALSLREIAISGGALAILLSQLEKKG
jgi:hypothetical protein